MGTLPAGTRYNCLKVTRQFIDLSEGMGYTHGQVGRRYHFSRSRLDLLGGQLYFLNQPPDAVDQFSYLSTGIPMPLSGIPDTG